RHEVAGKEHPAPWMPPAQQRFERAALAASEVDDRLVLKRELLPFERARELRRREARRARSSRSRTSAHVGTGMTFDDPTAAGHALAASYAPAALAMHPRTRP